MGRGEVSPRPFTVTTGPLAAEDVGILVRWSNAPGVLVAPRARGVQRPGSGCMGGLPRPGLVLAGGPGTPNVVVSCLGRTAHLTFPRPLIRGGPHDLKAPVPSRGSFLFGSGGASFGSVGSTGKE